MNTLRRAVDRIGDRLAVWVLGRLDGGESTPAEDLYFALVRSGLHVDVTWRTEPDAGRVRRVSYTNTKGDRVVAHDFTPDGRHLLTVWDFPADAVRPLEKE